MAAELPSSEEEVQALLQSAVSSRASHIRKEAETITMANVRRMLESDLGLEKSTLDVHKVFIRQLVDELLLSSENAEAQEEAAVSEEAPKPKKKSLGKKAREGERSPDQREMHSEDLQENDHVEAPKRKKQKKEKAKKETSLSEEDEDGGGSHAELSEEGVDVEAPKGKSQKSKPKKDKEIKEVLEDGGGSRSEMSEEDSDVSERRKPKKASSKTPIVKPVQNRKVEHLKKVIKACGLTIPPQVYKRVKQQPEEKQDKSLIKELEEFLSRNGLSSDPSEKEIKAAKRKIAREKDMEGIDTTNIILEPRGRRATSQLFAPVYNPPPVEYDSGSEQDDDGEEDNEEESDDAASGSDDEKDTAAANDSDDSE